MSKLLPALVCLLSANTAFAAMIDFTDSEFAAAHGNNSYSTTVDGVGVTLTAAPAPSADLEYSSDGLGVDYRDWGEAEDQIEGVETLTISFDQEVTIDEIYVANLFDWGLLQVEVGEYSLDNGGGTFAGDSHSGDLTVGVGAATTSITLQAQGSWNHWTDNGFTLAGLSFNTGTSTASVPELDPGSASGALALAVGGMLVLNERRRRS